MTAEITYDLVMTDEMGFVEGCYRLPGSEWQVLIADHCLTTFAPTADGPVVWFVTWDNGQTGVNIHVPDAMPLNCDTVERLLGHALGVTRWIEVRGPDSITLR